MRHYNMGYVFIYSYQSECGSISQHSNNSVDTTTATAGTRRTVAEEESFDVYCDSVAEESVSHVSLLVVTSYVLCILDSMLLQE